MLAGLLNIRLANININTRLSGDDSERVQTGVTHHMPLACRNMPVAI